MSNCHHSVPSSKSAWPVLVALCFAALCLAPNASGLINTNLQMQLGNPSGAIADSNNHSNFLIVRPIEAMDYNDSRGQANWASWDLTSADANNAVSRQDSFAPDTNLPSGFYQVADTEYSGSGYDRGHLCPSADRTDSTNDNDMTFLMSNMMPQAPDNNRITWAGLEDYCRTLADAGNEVLITCGPSGYDGSHISSSTHVLIPSNTWKIVVVVPLGAGTALSRITTTTNRVIAIRLPNTNGLNSNWTNFITTARSIELETGFNFFTALPGPIASAFRARIDAFTNAAAPAITNFAPTSGLVGSNIVIAGLRFSSASAVKFNGLATSYYVNSDNQIVATIPANALTGPLSVTTPAGTFTTSTNFTVTTVAAPDLAVTSTHTGNFTQGDTNDTYTLTVNNAGNSATTGTVTLTNVLPAGLTATAFTGTGWTANLGTLTATRSDALAAGLSYPALTLTVSVATNAAASLTNRVVIGGGGEVNFANNTNADVTVVLAASVPTSTTLAATGVGATNATFNGTVNPNNQPATTLFEYGLTTNYGSMLALGTFSGSNSQNLTATFTNLSPTTTYHYRVASTNVLGGTKGADQTFTTTNLPLPDLAVTLSHTGNFTQGDTAATYTLIVTNRGTGPTTGLVSVVDTLPPGFTATAFSGTGWTTNLATLTATRTNALAGGTAYPALTLTVSVAGNAANLLTNLATVSGGGETNTANNTASDVTIVNLLDTNAVVTLIGWDMSTLTTTGYGPSPFAPTTNAPNLAVVGLTRGPNMYTNSPGIVRAWGGVSMTNTSAASAISGGQYATFSLTASNGYTVSFTTVTKLDYRRSSTGVSAGVLQYQLGAGAFVDISNLNYSVSTSGGASLGPIDLSGIVALQNVGAGTNVTFRIVSWGGTTAAGTCYLYDVGNSTALDVAVSGIVRAVAGVNNDVKLVSGTYNAGSVSLTYSNATAGAAYYLQTSTNLSSWQNLVTNLAAGNGTLQFLSTPATNAQQFYRVVR